MPRRVALLRFLVLVSWLRIREMSGQLASSVVLRLWPKQSRYRWVVVSDLDIDRSALIFEPGMPVLAFNPAIVHRHHFQKLETAERHIRPGNHSYRVARVVGEYTFEYVPFTKAS